MKRVWHRWYTRFWPWRALWARDVLLDTYRSQIREQGNRIERGTAENKRLAEELRTLRRLIGARSATAPGSALERAGSITPEFVLAGFGRGSQGVRLIASRNLDGTNLTMTDMKDPPPRWALQAKLGQALFIDRADYGAAIEEMARIWRNWERDARAHQGHEAAQVPSPETLKELE